MTVQRPNKQSSVLLQSLCFVQGFWPAGTQILPWHVSPVAQSASLVQDVGGLGTQVLRALSHVSLLLQSLSEVHEPGAGGAQNWFWQTSPVGQSASLVQAVGAGGEQTPPSHTSPLEQSASLVHFVMGNVQLPDVQTSPVWQSASLVQLGPGNRQKPARHLLPWLHCASVVHLREQVPTTQDSVDLHCLLDTQDVGAGG